MHVKMYNCWNFLNFFLSDGQTKWYLKNGLGVEDTSRVEIPQFLDMIFEILVIVQKSERCGEFSWKELKKQIK